MATNNQSTAFPLTVQTQSGTGSFGQVPGQLTLPPVAADLSAELPGLSNLNSAASTDILSNLQGTLSPGTMQALQDANASSGVGMGMPGSQLNWNSLYGNIANASEQQQQTGLQEYNSTVPTVSGTQTLDPSLMSQIQYQNAVDWAAPNPEDAAWEQVLMGVASGAADSLAGSATGALESSC